MTFQARNNLVLILGDTLFLSGATPELNIWIRPYVHLESIENEANVFLWEFLVETNQKLLRNCDCQAKHVSDPDVNPFTTSICAEMCATKLKNLIIYLYIFLYLFVFCSLVRSHVIRITEMKEMVHGQISFNFSKHGHEQGRMKPANRL